MAKSALPPPDGQASNFDHPESLRKWNAVTVAVCLSIVTVLFVLRFYVRLFLKREWVFEDSKSANSITSMLRLTNISRHGYRRLGKSDRKDELYRSTR